MTSAKNMIQGIFISQPDGRFLVSALFDDKIQPQLLSAFIGALQMFGKEAVGKIDEIIIKGLDLEVLIVQKYDLILTAIMSMDMRKENVREEAEVALCAFYERYSDLLIGGCTCISEFEDFEMHLKAQVEDYFSKHKDNPAKESFWHNLIKQFKK